MFSRLSKGYINSFRGVPKDVWLLSLVVLINRSGMMVLFFLSLYVTKIMGYDAETAGIIIMLHGAGSFVGSFGGGWLSDKTGPEVIQFYSLLVTGVGYIVLGLIDNIYLFGAGLFLVSVFSEAFRPANISMISMVTPSDSRTKSFSLNRLAINLGVAIGPAAGGFLALYDYFYLFLVDGITCLIASFIFYILFIKRKADKIKVVAASANGSTSPLSDKVFIYFLTLVFVVGIIFNQIFNTWPLYLENVYFLRENNIGILLAINAIICVLFEMPIMHRVGNRKHIRVMFYGMILLTAGLALLPFGHGFLYAFILTIIWSFGELLVLPLASTFVSKRADKGSQGKYFAIYAVTFSTAFMIGPVFGTTIFEQLGYNMLWYIVAFLGLYNLIGFVWLRKMLGKEKKATLKIA